MPSELIAEPGKSRYALRAEVEDPVERRSKRIVIEVLGPTPNNLDRPWQPLKGVAVPAEEHRMAHVFRLERPRKSHRLQALLLTLLVACAVASTAAVAADCVAPVTPQGTNCPAGYVFKQGTHPLPNPLSVGPVIYYDSQCCKVVVNCPKYGTPECPYPSLGGWAGANIDRPGGDYANFDLNGTYPSDCRDACAKDSKCQAWTYVQPGVQGPKARCWLKASVPPPHPNTCCISEVMDHTDLGVH